MGGSHNGVLSLPFRPVHFKPLLTGSAALRGFLVTENGPRILDTSHFKPLLTGSAALRGFLVTENGPRILET